MEIQEDINVHAPGHMQPPEAAAEVTAASGSVAGHGQARTATEADAYRAQRALLNARIAEFQAAARERGVDIADVDFDTITERQLEAVAAERLAAMPNA